MMNYLGVGLPRSGLARVSVTALMLLAIQLSVWGAEVLPCKKPNLSTSGCVSPDPNGYVASCGDVTSGETTCKTAATYDIKQFPDGTTPSATGATKTVAADCYQKTACSWDGVNEKCVASMMTLPALGTWFQAQKTVVNADVTCPEG